MTENIETALLAVYNAVGYVQKERRVGGSEGGYSYAGERELIAAIRPAMKDAGITMRIGAISDVGHETYVTKSGTSMNRVTLQAIVTFSHAASLTTVEVAALGEGSDVGDKATNKAVTGAYKYALRHTFCIETGDDPDDTASTEQERGQRPTPPTAKKAKDTAVAQPEVNEPGFTPEGVEYILGPDGNPYTPAQCHIHEKPWTFREGDDGLWGSDGVKGKDGKWCQVRPRALTAAERAGLAMDAELTETVARPETPQPQTDREEWWPSFQNHCEERGINPGMIATVMGRSFSPANVEAYIQDAGGFPVGVDALLAAATERTPHAD